MKITIKERILKKPEQEIELLIKNLFNFKLGDVAIKFEINYVDVLGEEDSDTFILRVLNDNKLAEELDENLEEEVVKLLGMVFHNEETIPLHYLKFFGITKEQIIKIATDFKNLI